MNVLVVSFASTTLDPVVRIQRILVGEIGKTVEHVAPAVHWGEPEHDLPDRGERSALNLHCKPAVHQRCVELLWRDEPAFFLRLHA